MQAQVQISGTVTGAEDGLSVPGVSVVVKDNPTIGTTTDMDGKYSITVPSSAQVLVFSFVGMKAQEVAINNRTIIDVQMESDVLEMDEVVVTALGITREKKSLGYTVQDVKGDDLVKAANPNVMTAMAGKIAGVEIRQSSGMPGAPAQIYIRGARSFSGTNTPLYVVDGLPISSENDYASNVTGAAYSNRALDIDPNDIASINVLKGQAAAALYGLRASNGVIVITTKKGSKSQVGRPVVSLSTNYTVDKVALLPDVQQTYAQGYSGSFAPANSFSYGPKITDLPDNATYGGNNYAGHDGEFFDPYKGDWVTPKAYNNAENFYDKNGYTWNSSVNISNANEFGNYAVGFGNTEQTGIIAETGMTRYTAKAAGEFKLAEKWNLNFSSNYADSKIQKLPSGNDSWLFTVYGAPASYDLMGTPYHQEGQLGQYRQISYRRGAVGVNPLWALENNHYYESTRRFFGNMGVEFKPYEWLTTKYQLGMDTYTTDNENYKEMGYGNLPSATYYPTPNNPVFRYLAPTGGEISNFGLTRETFNSLFTMNFAHKFSDDFSGNLLIGNEVDDNSSEYYSASGVGFSTPGWNNLNNTTTQYANYNKYHRRTVGFFGNLALDYKNMLYFNATGRYDVVSSMPNGNRGFFYPSASLGFIFTELDAVKSLSFLSFGKFRASYAEVGQAADTFNPLPVFVTGGGSSGFLDYGMSYPVTDITGYKLSSTIYDPNLIPQNTSTYELGLDLKFFNNRLGIDYTFFSQRAKDQIFGVPMAGSTGFSTFVTNAGEMTSVGHEIMFYANPVKMKNLEWDMTLNFTKIVNKVVSLAEGVENISLGGYVTPNIRASAGDTYPSIYGEQYARDDQGRILVDSDPASSTYGLPMVGDFGKIGDVSPDFVLGFTNTFTIYKLLTLSAQVDWKQGGEMYSGSNRLMNLYGSSATTEDRVTPFVYDGYKADGTKNDIERGGPTDPNAYQTLYNDILGSLPESNIMETSFIKLREVSISISIPKKIIAPVKLSKASVGFVMRNVLLWTTMENFDPESSQGQGNMQGGMDYMSLPQTTSYGFSLNLTF